MKTLLAIVLFALLAGCSTVLPSMKYCDEIDYQRRGDRITLLATCSVNPGMAVAQ